MRLKHLEIRHCSIDDKLSSKKFPSLHRLELIHIENLPQMTKWKGVRMLSLSKVRANQLWKFVNIEIFPKLAALYIESAEGINLKVLQPLSTLKKLSIKTSGKIPCLSDLKDRFPLLTELCLDGEVDDSDIPNLASLKKVEVIPIPLKKFRRNWVKKCRNL